ncbi:MAG: DnaJ domain-containing protein, partial [Deltaproteobacteria bacterium]|nr:DnaJ domain-containing protein [Deltaproteobacteria bacterium]
MSQLNSYQELRLDSWASEREIRAAFRKLAKEYHPDSSSSGGDAGKFQKAHEAYKNLLAKARLAREKESQVNEALKTSQYQFISQSQKGLDIYYELALAKFAEPFSLAIPKKTTAVCPRCFGQGRTLVQKSQGSVYRPGPCPRCGGSGQIENTSHITVQVTPAMVAA